jgi:acetylornithine deacetylase
MNATELLGGLVSINSVNPDLVPGGPGEGEIAGFIADWCEEQGLEVHRLEGTPNRPSVVAIARGTGGGRSLMFNGHTDTVGVAGMSDPFTPRLEGARMYGRGAYDMKGGVAAMLVAVAQAKKLGLRGDVIAACVADEEYASLGSFELVRHFRADAAIITEPSALEIVAAHKGFVWAEIEVRGKAAHGSRPELGIDAIAKMGPLLLELEKLDGRLRASSPHPLLNTGSVHASLITGGQELSSYPASCRLWLERRTVPGESSRTLEAELRELLEGIGAKDPQFSYTLTMGLERPPHEISPEAPILRTLRRHAAKITGREPRIVGEPFWTDCAVLSTAGIPTFMFGPDGAGAHAAEEWVDLNSVEQCGGIYLETLKEFCA